MHSNTPKISSHKLTVLQSDLEKGKELGHNVSHLRYLVKPTTLTIFIKNKQRFLSQPQYLIQCQHGDKHLFSTSTFRPQGGQMVKLKQRLVLKQC